MITRQSCRVKSLRYAGAALLLLAGIAGAVPAEARGIVADSDPPTDITTLGCAIGDGSSCNPLTNYSSTISSLSNFTFNNNQQIYAYTDGLITVGSPLEGNTVTISNIQQNGLASLANELPTGAFFITAGLNNYGSSVKMLEDVGQTNRIAWEIQTGAGLAVFAVEFDTGGTTRIVAGTGAQVPSWFSNTTGACCTVGVSPSQTDGAFLPTGSIIGSDLEAPSYVPYTNAFADSSFDYENTSFTDFTVQPVGVPVPEPSTWAMMALGLLSLGMVTRRGQKRL